MQHAHHISIIDDDESVREAAVNLFRSMGLPTAAYGSAEEFLASGMIQQTSCLVLDVHMPGMGGLKLQSHLKSIGRRIPIVFVTAFNEERTRATAMNEGAICFLSNRFAKAICSKASARPCGRTTRCECACGSAACRMARDGST